MLCYVRCSLDWHLQKASGSSLFSVFNLSILSIYHYYCYLNWLLLLTLFHYNPYHFHPLYLPYLLPQFPNFFNYITMPNKINDSNSTLASTGSNDQVVVPNMQGTLLPSRPATRDLSHANKYIPRSQCRPSSNNTSTRHHSQSGRSDLRRDKNIRLGQATLEVNNFPFTFNPGPTKSISLYLYPAANNSAGRNARCGCWMNEIKAWGDRLDIRAASTTKSEAIDRRIVS